MTTINEDTQPIHTAEEARAALRVQAEKQAAAYARMLELGRGVGALGREMFDDMLAWDDLSENGHADVILGLLDRISELEAGQASREVTEDRVDAAERIVGRHLSHLSKRDGWAEDDTAIGGQAANLVRQLTEAGLIASREATEAEVEAARVELYMGDSRVDTARIRAALEAAREVRS